MPRRKIRRVGEYIEVIYDDEHWRLLRELRGEAAGILKALERRELRGAVYGSIARGDVHAGSDIDVILLYPVSSYMVELALEEAGYSISHKAVVQATPRSTPKAYIFLDGEEKLSISYPLAYLQGREYEFYRFGGLLDGGELREDKRVPGVSKELVLIQPTLQGHTESPVIGRESEVAGILGISIDTVLERVRVLSRRDTIGRTGVFVNIQLGPHNSIEEAVREEAHRNPHFRRILAERKSPII